MNCFLKTKTFHLKSLIWVSVKAENASQSIQNSFGLWGTCQHLAPMAVLHRRTALCTNGILTWTPYFPEIYNIIFNKRFKASRFLVLFRTSLQWWKILSPLNQWKKLSPKTIKNNWAVNPKEKKLCPKFYTQPYHCDGTCAEGVCVARCQMPYFSQDSVDRSKIKQKVLLWKNQLYCLTSCIPARLYTSSLQS